MGSNIDVGSGFIIGIDTDIMWSDKKDTKDVKSSRKKKTKVVSEELGRASRTEDFVQEESAVFDPIMHHTLK